MLLETLMKETRGKKWKWRKKNEEINTTYFNHKGTSNKKSKRFKKYSTPVSTRKF